MDHSFADELYSGTLKLANGGSGPMSTASHDQNESHDPELDHLSHDDPWGSFHEDQSEENSLSDLNKDNLDREWQRRHDQFHTIGYRDGLIAGQEASAQEGFNRGFKESVLGGYNWGLVRGVTSTLSCLPDGLREKLVETEEEKVKLQVLYKSVHSMSTTDALKCFHDGILARSSAEESESADQASSGIAGFQDQTSYLLENYFGELKSLIAKLPAVEVNLVVDH